MQTRPWYSYVKRFFKLLETRSVDPVISPPATEWEIRSLVNHAASRQLMLDPSYLDLLRYSNGIVEAGLRLYGAGLPASDALGRLNLVEQNEHVFMRPHETVLGGNHRDFFMCDTSGNFYRRDREHMDIVDAYTSCDALLVSIFKEHVEHLKCR